MSVKKKCFWCYKSSHIATKQIYAYSKLISTTSKITHDKQIVLNAPFWDRLTKPTWDTFYIFFFYKYMGQLGHFLYNFFFYKYMGQPGTLL